MEALPDDRVTVYGVNYKDRTPEQGQGRSWSELGNPYSGHHVADGGRNRQSIEWGVYALPETFVIDGDGTGDLLRCARADQPKPLILSPYGSSLALDAASAGQ